MLSQDLFLQKFNVKPNIVRHFSPFLYYQEVRTFHFLILLHFQFPSFLLFTYCTFYFVSIFFILQCCRLILSLYYHYFLFLFH
jgi:hypothetical protein